MIELRGIFRRRLTKICLPVCWLRLSSTKINIQYIALQQSNTISLAWNYSFVFDDQNRKCEITQTWKCMWTHRPAAPIKTTNKRCYSAGSPYGHSVRSNKIYKQKRWIVRQPESFAAWRNIFVSRFSENCSIDQTWCLNTAKNSQTCITQEKPFVTIEILT